MGPVSAPRCTTARPFWANTVNVKTLKEKSVSPTELERRFSDMTMLSKFDVDDIGAEAPLFQTGYLTITGEHRDDFDTLYSLAYPNRGVQVSLNRGMLSCLMRRTVCRFKKENTAQLA